MLKRIYHWFFDKRPEPAYSYAEERHNDWTIHHHDPGAAMRERQFQSHVIQEIKKLFPTCVILKNDPTYLQGVPDLSIFYRDRWAMLEVKPSLDAPRQPNQEYYVSTLRGMSFAAFICPENEEEVLNDLQRALQPRRPTRLPQRE